MDKIQSNAVTKIIEEYKRMETQYQKNSNDLIVKTEELESKKSLLKTLKDNNKSILSKIASMKKAIESDKNAQKNYASTKAEYDKLVQVKNDLINRTKKIKYELSQKKSRIKKIEFEIKQIEKAVDDYKDSAEQGQAFTNYDREIKKREQLIKEQDELKINISYLKKSNALLKKDIEEMDYILKRLENSII